MVLIEFGRQPDLKVVTRQRFMKGKSLRRVPRPRLWVAHVDEELARTAAIDGRRVVIARRRLVRYRRGHCRHAASLCGQRHKPGTNSRGSPLDRRLRSLQHVLGRVKYSAESLRNRRRSPEITRPKRGRTQVTVLLSEPSDDFETQLVYVHGSAVQMV